MFYTQHNSVFLSEREHDWLALAGADVWIVCSITPLRPRDGAIDPLNQRLLAVINAQSLPEGLSSNGNVNGYVTRPNENGVINEDLRGRKDGYGHRIQVFRNGHCEFLPALESGITRRTQLRANERPGDKETARSLSYCVLTPSCDIMTRWLSDAWTNGGLPFNDMTLTVELTNPRGIGLYTGDETRGWGPYVGPAIRESKLCYTDVINRRMKPRELQEAAIRRFVNCFGFVIDDVYDAVGRLNRPRKLQPF